MKSSALGIGRDVLFEAAAPLIGDYPGSPEGLIDSLARSPSQVIPISEFGRFLAAAQRGYYEPIKALLAAKADPNMGRPSPLALAAEEGSNGVAKLLLESGARPRQLQFERTKSTAESISTSISTSTSPLILVSFWGDLAGSRALFAGLLRGLCH